MAHNAERTPLMDGNAGIVDTTRQFLRSFSVLSDDSDFDELDEPDTPDILDNVDEVDDAGIHHSATGGISVTGSKPSDLTDGKLIPYSSIHLPRKGYSHLRKNCWMKEPINVRIIDVQREEHPHMTRKAFNPNLYTIEIHHGEYTWTVKRRYKHFDSLHKALRLFRAKYSIPVPTKQHRERRQSMREERKERKKQKKTSISKFPKKPEIFITVETLKKRQEHLESYLQSIVNSKWYRNHTEVLKFLEVSEYSFVNRLGRKWKEGDVNKCSGGRRISIGCCGCLKKYHVAVRWSNRWLIVKDTFIAYVRPRDGLICDVMLMDSDFKVEGGMSATGAPHGILISNQTRYLLAKCWTSRKADEWEAAIKKAAADTGFEFIQRNRFNSYAPVREKSYARWFVDGAPYFEAVAEALEKAREEIFITDWWLSPAIYLKRNVSDREYWRLDQVLARRANAGVKVFVLLYKELKIALTIDSQYSKNALRSKCSENIKVIRHPDHVYSGNSILLWAHHEKMVVIDQRTAFLGGLDLCYGRWDDEQHRMTDFGSVTGNISIPTELNGKPHQPPSKLANSTRGPQSKHRHKETVRPPSTILESPESHMADSGYDCGDLLEGDSSSEPKRNSVARPSSAVDIEVEPRRVEENERNIRHSLCSEQEFGSGDILTDNDSLENVDKVGYTNIAADITVHQTTGSENREGLTNGGTTTQVSKTDSLCSSVCNITDNRNNTNLSPKSQELKEGVGSTNKNMPIETNSSNESVKLDDISLTAEEQILGTITKQIITDASKLPEASTNREKKNSNAQEVKDKDVEKVVEDGKDVGADEGDGISDQNKNRMVRFKSLEDEDVITEEHLEPVAAKPLEGTPPKHDAAIKRETWASRKIRQTFRMTRKEDQEDNIDGKADISANDEEGGNKFRSKWRMVLNIKKLENAAKKEDDNDLSPDSPFTKNFMPTSPHQSISTRIRQSMPFRTQQQIYDEELFRTLYPWKKTHFWRRDDSMNVEMKSFMKTATADDTEGLQGSSKIWIGKDYLNFIHKDPVDVHNPFEDSIDRNKTPRMPWHDIGAVVYGKAARDVARHFIRRWNFCKNEKFKKKPEYPLLIPKSYTKCEVSQPIKDITYESTTQILRSVCPWSAGIKQTETSIHQAYIECIKNAKHYIYIENQFFISQVKEHDLVQNLIADALLERILRAHKEGKLFRVYVVLPLLPAFEGEIGANGGYAIQAVLHWNYMSISKGPNSLWTHLQQKVGDPMKYIIFCGLRTHAELRDKLVTELVYVHSKLMIVDDDTVIIGSANINDRSLIGHRDSEMAVIVEDTKKFKVTMGGEEHLAGGFASSLRRTLFREHLGIDEKDYSIDLSDPVSDSFYKNVWTNQASRNTSIYYKVFQCIPDDHIKSFAEVKEVTGQAHLCETDPDMAKQELKKIKGRIVLFPLYFLSREESIVPTGANKEALMPVKLWL